MEILVILILSLFVFIIAAFVTFFVVIRRNHNRKVYNINNDRLDLDEDDLEYEENNKPLEIKAKNKKSNEVNKTKENTINDDKKDIINEEIADIEEVKAIDNNIKDLINVSINNRNFVFLANNNIVNKNDKVKVLLNKNTYIGTITKANYQKDISNFKVKPKELVIIKDE